MAAPSTGDTPRSETHYGKDVSWLLLGPPTAVVVAVIVLIVALRAVEREVVALGESRRRSGAAAVATDELQRSAALVRNRIEQVQADAKRRIALPPRRDSQQTREHR